METTSLPLDLDLNSVDTSFPLINGGEIVDFTVEKVESKTTATGSPMLAITFKSLSPAKSLKGDELAPGVSLFHNINLAATGKATPQMVTQNIAQYTQAVGFSGTLGDFLNSGAMTTQGKTVRIKVSYTPEGPDKKGVVRKARNEVGVFIKQ